MASFTSLAMSKHFANDPRISTKSTFLGLFKKHIYNPTDSPLTALHKEFTPSDGAKIEKALGCNDPQDRASQLTVISQMKPAALGNYMLEACMSADHQFAAVMLYQFKQLSYEPVSSLCVFEGETAEAVCELL